MNQRFSLNHKNQNHLFDFEPAVEHFPKRKNTLDNDDDSSSDDDEHSLSDEKAEEEAMKDVQQAPEHKKDI